MIGRRIILGFGLALVLLFACAAWALSDRSPRPLRSIFDGVVRFASGHDPETRCTSMVHLGADYVFKTDEPRKCHRFGLERHFSGTYVDMFEGQQFIADGQRVVPYVLPRPMLWLVVDTESDTSRVPAFARRRRFEGQAWHLEFEGRQTYYFGRYGHFGMSDAEIVVDRIDQARPLPAPE